MHSFSYRESLGLVLLTLLCVGTFFGSGHVAAQLNCRTAQCVEVPYNNVGTETTVKNAYCLMSWVTRSDYTGYVSYAYSDTVVITKGYGKNSKGGTAQGGAFGFYVPCSGSAHCGNNLTPVSGDASNWGQPSVTPPGGWKNQCSGQGG
jgi:hypothetical protein